MFLCPYICASAVVVVAGVESVGYADLLVDVIGQIDLLLAALCHPSQHCRHDAAVAIGIHLVWAVEAYEHGELFRRASGCIVVVDGLCGDADL